MTDSAPADLSVVVPEEPVVGSGVEPDIVTETDVVDTIDATTETGVEDQTTQTGRFRVSMGECFSRHY